MIMHKSNYSKYYLLGKHYYLDVLEHQKEARK